MHKTPKSEASRSHGWGHFYSEVDYRNLGKISEEESKLAVENSVSR